MKSKISFYSESCCREEETEVDEISEAKSAHDDTLDSLEVSMVIAIIIEF